MEKAKDMILTWAAFGNSMEKIGFIKSFLSCLGPEELRHVKNIATKIASRTTNKNKGWIGPRMGNLADVSTLGPARIEGPMATPSVELTKQPKIWFSNHKREDIVAIDVEKVQFKDGRAEGSAGIVSVVDYLGNPTTVCEMRIQHPPGSFVVNRHTLRINGIRADDLRNGIPLTEVQKQLRELLKNKIVVTVAGTPDFLSLGLSISDFETFDLQEVYQRKKLKEYAFCVCEDDEECGCYVYELMSLRDMFYFHFKQDFQRGEHSAYRDAKSTIKVFMEGYVTQKKGESGNSRCEKPFPDAVRRRLDECPNLRSMEKKGLFYCCKSKKFEKKCECCLVQIFS